MSKKSFKFVLLFFTIVLSKKIYKGVFLIILILLSPFLPHIYTLYLLCVTNLIVLVLFIEMLLLDPGYL
jgi:hypothetical protein